jgi:integrase
MAVKVGRRKDKPGWWVFVNFRGQRTKRCFPNDRAGEKAARAFAEKLAARLKWAAVSGEAIVLSQPDQRIPTVGNYLTNWLHAYAKVNCKASTYEEYERAVEGQLVPALGQKPLDALKREDLKQFIANCVESGKSRSTIRNYLAPLKSAYFQAVEDGLLTVNPVTRVSRLCKEAKAGKEAMQPLSRKEVNILLGQVQEKVPYLHPLLLCAVRTGLRRGELIGLQWGDVDFHSRFLIVRRAIVRNRVGAPKSGKVRRVDLSGQLVATFQHLKELRELEAMAKNVTLQPDAWVFLSPKGYRLDERNLETAWARCLKAAGIRQIRFHDLRHTFASLLIEQGAHPKYIQEQMGHSSIQVTMDTYGHLFPNRNRGLVDRLDMTEGEFESAPQSHPQEKVAKLTLHKSAEIMVRPTGVEPVTPRSVVWCSIH